MAEDILKEMEKHRQKHEIQKRMLEPPAEMAISSEPEVSVKLIDVHSKHSLKRMRVNVVDEKGEHVGWDYMDVKTPYKEIMTPDVSTAFLDLNDQSVLRNIEQLLSQIKSFGESNELDLSEAYNQIADYHNAMAVSSKATGEGAKIAKSQFITQKTVGKLFTRDEGKGKGIIGFFTGK